MPKMKDSTPSLIAGPFKLLSIAPGPSLLRNYGRFAATVEVEAASGPVTRQFLCDEGSLLSWPRFKRLALRRAFALLADPPADETMGDVAQCDIGTFAQQIERAIAAGQGAQQEVFSGLRF